MSGMSKLKKKYQIKATEEKNRTDTAVCVRACVCVCYTGWIVRIFHRDISERVT
jgi:hypothetical protein